MLGKLRRSLGMKILVSYLIVILVGVGVLLATSGWTVPAAYTHHLSGMQGMMGSMAGSGMIGDLSAGFRAAVRESLALATGAAVVVAVVVSIFITRQVVQPIQQMKQASQRIAEGHYDERVDVTVNPVRDELDELGQLAVSFNRMAADLEQTEALRRQLIGDVAHELRTPLTTIMGTAEALIDGVLPAEPETFHRIYKEADRLQRLVADLQELSRVEAGAFQLECRPVPVDDLVQGAVERLGQQYAEKQVDLQVTVPDGLPRVLVDADRVGQVLLNLVGNALQYTPPGGTVTITAQPARDAVMVVVRDTGIGIPAEHLPRLFDRFYRVDKSRSRAGGGSGIGLTISKVLIEAHGGTISAASPGPGQGSEFTFTLPAVP